MLTSRRDQIVFTGDRFLDYMLSEGGLRREDLELAVRAVRGAMGDPDRHVQLRGAELLGQWLGWKGARDRDNGADRIAAVTITLNAVGADAGTELPRGRLEVHLAGNGHAAGIPPAGEREQPSD
jgi:hypothetical protein